MTVLEVLGARMIRSDAMKVKLAFSKNLESQIGGGGLLLLGFFLILEF